MFPAVLKADLTANRLVSSSSFRKHLYQLLKPSGSWFAEGVKMAIFTLSQKWSNERLFMNFPRKLALHYFYKESKAQILYYPLK